MKLKDIRWRFLALSLFLVLFNLINSGCSKAETFVGTISHYIYFVKSNDYISFYGFTLAEIKGKEFIIPKENVEKFGFKPADLPIVLIIDGRSIPIKNVWLESPKEECIGKKVKIMAKNKVFLKIDNTDVKNHFEVIEIEWIK